MNESKIESINSAIVERTENALYDLVVWMQMG